MVFLPNWKKCFSKHFLASTRENMNGASTIGNMIEFSWAKSREILFPFHFKRWLKILIIVWFAGAGIQGFSANFKVPAQPSTAPQKVAIPAMLSQLTGKAPQIPPSVGFPAPPPVEQIQKPLQEKRNSFSVGQGADRIAKLGAKEEPPKAKANLVLAALLVSGAIALGLVFTVFFMWLSSRFNFVLLNTIKTRDPAIKEPFKNQKEAGNSYFVWSLAFFGIALAAFLVTGLLGWGLFGIAKGHVALGVTFGIFVGILLLAIFLGMIFIGTVMRDFVLPVMYCEKIPAMAAFDKFLGASTFSFGKVFRYLLTVFGLWILAVIVQSIVGIFAVIGGVIAGGLVAILGILLAMALPSLKLPLIILGGLVAIALILAVIVVIGMVMLPVVIFFRVFALAYLTRLYPNCDLLGFTGKGS